MQSPRLTPKSDDPHTLYLQLVDAAIEGSDTFEHKREVIDEYGWRHFGEIYADHEAVFHKGPNLLVSHYNNQYDPIAGCAFQFLRSGDWRWWLLMHELALHVRDIDVYHTDEDKSAYNHGLFWHTYHYVDAGTSTHRSYPHPHKDCHRRWSRRRAELRDGPHASLFPDGRPAVAGDRDRARPLDDRHGRRPQDHFPLAGGRIHRPRHVVGIVLLPRAGTGPRQLR